MYLRRVTHNDEAEFLALMRASEELHQPWIQAPTTPALFKYYLQRIRRNDHEGFAICRGTDEVIVGVININNIVRGSFLSASLGYYVGATFQGQGYMQAGLTRLIDYAFSTMGLHRLEANIQPDNLRSQELVRRCGFEYEGLSKNFLFLDGAWRDHQRWCVIDSRAKLRP
ncbi:MAG TPA: RimJ/RimL family protein N-acetyltransferase [Gammaproteobacteria bacterium]|nr:RimJ/RimL family protein N-acetyltransferase [Gammaproteobacteria bacterium]